MNRLLDYLPHGDLVDDASWKQRHHFLLWVLFSQTPVLAIFGFAVGGNSAWIVLVAAAVPVLTAAGGYLAPGRRSGSMFVAAGFTASCMGWVILSHGSIEAHFSFFVIIGFLTLYQHWVPFVWNIVFTTISHGIGSALVPTLIFNHPDAQQNPWLWSVIHGIAVLLACIGVMIFCRTTEDEQARRAALTKQLSDAQIRQREFTSDLLLNLARRNQSMFGRQLDIINDLEERERDPDTLAELFRLDHLATRVRRNAESLLVLSGEQPARVWSAPVPLRDVVRAGIAETEDLDRITFTVDERPRVAGAAVADLTHLLAELAENAVRYSSPSTTVTVQSRPSQRIPGAHLLIIEDTGIGMPSDELTAANELLAHPHEVDLSVSRRLGFHVVSRLAERHRIDASLTPTPGGGVTAVLVLPPDLFAEAAGTSPVASTTSSMTLPAIGGDGAANGAGEAVTVTGLDGANGHPNGNGHSNGRSNGHGTNGNGTHRLPETAGTNGTAEYDTDADDDAAPPPPLGGRHSWPGHPDRSDRADSRTDDRPDDRPAETDTGRPPSPPLRAAPRALIHPIVVPPPSADRGIPAEPPRASSSTEERDETALAPAPRRSEEGAPVLKRRVPQTHLAPELTRPRPPAPAARPTPTPAATPTAPTALPSGPPSTTGVASLDALSRYQASRQAARTAIGDDDPPTDHGGDTHDR